ncbi:MAG: exonuclease domain-containing protein [Chitinophagales bacterium]|nr:hypothetical protein [Chitinophagales bacterium]
MFAVIDVETTGGHLYDDRITEIAIYVTDGKKLVNSFSSLVNPERKISPFVVKLTGITDEMVSTAPFFKDIAQEVYNLIDGCVFVAHNITFDYTMVKREFKRLGITFRSPNVCTVQLSQRIFKNQDSYSLGNLCKSLGIGLEDRHRAYGDAEATALLLHKMIAEKGKDYIVNHSNSNSQNIEFEGNVTQAMVDALPEEPGVFRFLNANGKALYIGSSKNIFGEVTKFLLNINNTNRYNGLFEKIEEISTEVFNSVIVANLQEIEEIRKERPTYNKMSTLRKYPVGIFENKYEGKNAFYIEQNYTEKALWTFINAKRAKNYLKRFIKENGLHHKKSNEEESINEYKEKVEEALLKELYPMRNFYIIRENSFSDVIYAILVEDFVYRGYAIIDKEFYDGKLSTIKEQIIYCENNPFVQKALQQYIRRKKSLKIIPC